MIFLFRLLRYFRNASQTLLKLFSFLVKTQSTMYTLHPTEQIFLLFVYSTYGNMSFSKFTSLYGVHPKTSAILYTYAVSKNPNIHPLWILQYLYWIRQYPSTVMACMYWNCDSKTWRNHIYQVLTALFCSLNTVSSFPNFLFMLFFIFFFKILFIYLYIYLFIYIFYI
jgi:hypothetical protein